MTLRRPLAGSSPPGRNRGIAAVVATLIVALAASASTYMVWRYSLALRHTENLVTRAQVDALARGAVHWAVSILDDDQRNPATRDADHLGEIWAQPLPPIPAEDATIAGRIRDEQGRFNLNNVVRGQKLEGSDVMVYVASPADVAIFRRLLGMLDLPAVLADALVDWLDSDDEVTQPGGAESVNYLALDPPRRAANMPIADPGELAGVKGFDPEVIAKLAPYVTALPYNRLAQNPGVGTQVNVNTASPEVLAAVVATLSPDDARRLAETRVKQPFAKIEDFLERIPESARKDVAALVAVRSEYFGVSGVVRRDRVVAGYRALLHRGAQGGTAIIALSEDPI